MKNLKNYIKSGILELYVLGMTSSVEAAEVQEMAALYEEVREEINDLSKVMEAYAQSHSIEPSTTIKPLLMASIDYTERLKQGEAISFPPALHKNSRISDYDFWLNADEATGPEDFENVHARIIGYTAEMATAIIWLKDFTPPEIHTREIEKFLIVQGTCDIFIGEEVHHLAPGDILSIPLHVSHHVKVTSSTTCILILERAAA